MRPQSSTRRIAAVAAVAASLWLIAGCSGSSPATTSGSPSAVSTSTPTVAASAACTDAAALKGSLEALKAVDVRQDGVPALTSALADAKAKLLVSVASATAALKPSVQGVQTSVDALESAASGLTTSNATQQAPAVATALAEVAVATRSLTTAISQGCPAG